MKNVKILLLLGVMLVNVMPYINDGKVEWKAAQAEAQLYFVEMMGNLYICADATDPFQRELFRSDIPCQDLYWTGSEFLPKVDNNQEYKLNIDPSGSCPEYADRNNWCTFFTLWALKGGDPCVWATLYYYVNLIAMNCEPDIGATDDQIPLFYSTFGMLSVGGQTSTYEELIEKIKQGSGICVIQPNHIYLIYGVITAKSGQNISTGKAYIFNTMFWADWTQKRPLSTVNLNDWNISVK